MTIVSEPEETKAPYSTKYLDHIVADANHLLAYATEAGIELETEITMPIVKAIKTGSSHWDTDNGGELLTAITKLAAKLHPVSAETLRACREDARNAIRGYKRVVYVLALIIIPLSIVGFITASLAGLIKSNIDTANNLVLKLHTDLSALPQDKLEAPTRRLAELQQLGIAIRVVYSRTKQLNHFLFDQATDQLQMSHEAGNVPVRVMASAAGENSNATPSQRLELPPGLGDTLGEVQKALSDLTRQYQKVRLYASNVLDGTSVLWGAVSTCLLPVLYALLGACAAVLRAFTQQTEKRTFTASYATPARFIVAAIGGGVIGLFNTSLGEGLTASPLALAFLVGYAADVFFSFLEGTMQNVTKPKS
ncbi:hypothetical protein E0H62_33745 [Rhizobium leguminosarum bv. viciae]|nr:hypothetical protein E0H62_33745 [Rhizobium leguminosarum bv. viciae]